MGACQNETENHCSGYKNITFTPNLNFMMFFFEPFYTDTFTCILWGREKRKLRK